MSIQHTTAVYECDQFKGNTRFLLLALAYYAYDKGPYPKGFPDPGFGWGYRGEDFFMECLNINRRQTITDCYTELQEAGAIQRKRRWHNTWLTFVDLDWLQAHKRTQATENEAWVDDSLVRPTSGLGHTTENVACVPTDNVATTFHGKRCMSATENVATSTSSLIYGVQQVVQRDDEGHKPANHIAPQVLPQAEAKATPASKPAPQPAPAPIPHKWKSGREFGKCDCTNCGISMLSWIRSGKEISCDPAPLSQESYSADGTFAVDEVQDTDGLEEEIPYK